MRKRITAWCLVAFILLVGKLPAQEQQPSAELFLESYTDQFQERFFEALKQRGIENYDRAEALLLECKQMQPDNPVVDHELGKALYHQQQYTAAEPYAIAAVSRAPDQYWYLHSLMEILSASYKTEASLEGVIPLDMPDIQLNLGKWYLQRGKGVKALEYLKDLPQTTQIRVLQEKARTLVAVADGNNSDGSKRRNYKAANTPPSDPADQLAGYRIQLTKKLGEGFWEEALEIAMEAVESYPLQPDFYLGMGQALAGMGQYSRAIDRLKEGELLLLGSDGIAQDFYKAFVQVYTAMGNTEKADYYTKKLIQGEE